MTKIPIKFLSFNDTAPEHGYWDQELLTKIFQGKEFEIVGKDSASEPIIIVVPGRQNVEYVDKINEYIKDIEGVLLIITSDEEGSFPVEQIKHPNIIIWLMTPQAGKQYTNVDRFIEEGYTAHFKAVTQELPDKYIRWFFAGQITHKRRVECAEALRQLSEGEYLETDGFAKGMPENLYLFNMEHSKVVPCPGGPCTPDSFRVFEALETGCIPLVDAYSGRSEADGYWEMIYGTDIAFPIIKNWSEVGNLIDYYNDRFVPESNRIFAWWQMRKRNLKTFLIDDYHKLIPYKNLPENGISVLIPTSPSYLNPSTAIIEETINTIRTHLPDSEIIIMFDGVRAEQEGMREKYDEYIQKVLWKCNREWTNIIPLVFREHTHQVGMARKALEYVRTDKILYVEHDTPLTPDCEIDWKKVSEMIEEGTANLVRFHFEAHIPEEHKYLMLDEKPTEYPAIRTAQWSQRPHVASTEFYKEILGRYFSADAKTFIEDRMHGVVAEAYKLEQVQGWNQFKLWIYYPDEQNIKRSYHTDARGIEPKYDMTF